VHSGKKNRRFSALLAGMAVCCCAPSARAGVFDPDVYGNGMSLGQYMREVPGGGQPGGPGYTFLMGKYEITNGQFAAFLNDAQLDGGATGKGSNMVFESNGRVRTVGDNFTMYRPAVVLSGIHYNPAAAIGQRYYVHANSPQMDYSYFPAGNMSLFGAMKFANWLTLDQGMDESELVYHEGPTWYDWRPMSISMADYQARDLNAAERQDLVDNYLGFRLPMDNQTTTASEYNEFYKAAAWDTTALVNRTYGMGRNSIDNRDANGYGLHPDYDPKFPHTIDDPFETDNDIQTTPVGFYDGTNWQRSQWNWPLAMTTFQTRANLNSYGIFDLSGNVNEWMQDREIYESSISHTMRSGSYVRDASELTVTYREGHVAPAFLTEGGLRIVRIPEPTSFSLMLIALLGAMSGRRRETRDSHLLFVTKTACRTIAT
jgi:hypothetical protein